MPTTHTPGITPVITAEIQDAPITAFLSQPVTALVTASSWPIGVTGQVTAHGVVTAEIKGTLTAQIQNAPLTAEARGFVTAQVTAGWPIGVTGQVTAHGELTAHGVVTAQIQNAPLTAFINAGNITAHGEVTARGTVTAEVKGVLTAQVQNSPITAFINAGNITAHGQVTAHGTVTAEAKGTVTAEAKGTVTAQVKGTLTAQIQNSPVTALVSEGNVTAHGQVTAHGTLTAEAKGFVTAQVTGGWPVGVTGQVTAHGEITAHIPWSSAWLLSGVSAVGTGTGMDSRAYGVGYLQANFSGNSASATLLGSHDSANWLPISAYYTGQVTADCWFSAQLDAYYPFLAARVDFVSASAGVTAAVSMHVTRA